MSSYMLYFLIKELLAFGAPAWKTFEPFLKMSAIQEAQKQARSH